MDTNGIRPVECSVHEAKTKSQVREGDIPANGKEFLTLFQAFLTPVINSECPPISFLLADYCPGNDEMEMAAEQGDDFCLGNSGIKKDTKDPGEAPEEVPREKASEFVSKMVPGETGLLSFFYPGKDFPEDLSWVKPSLSPQDFPEFFYRSDPGGGDPALLGKVHYQGAVIAQEPVLVEEIKTPPQAMQIPVDKGADSRQPVLNGVSEFKEACPEIGFSTENLVPKEKMTRAQGVQGINPLPDIKEPGSFIKHRLFHQVGGEPMIIKETGFQKDLGAVDQQTAKRDVNNGTSFPDVDLEAQSGINLVTGEAPVEESGRRITMDRLPAKIRTFLNNSENTNRPRTLELQLEPETLGTVKVTVNWTKGRISAEFLAQTDSAAAALNSGLETLKEGLSRLQINITGLSVAVAGQLGKETGSSQLPVPKRERSRVERGRSPEQVHHSSISFHSGTSSVNCLI